MLDGKGHKLYVALGFLLVGKDLGVRSWELGY